MLKNFDAGIIGKEKSVLVGLSGGADSVCLLFNLLEYSKAGNNLSVSAIHCNHQLRGTADSDEAFCVRLCEKLGVPLYVERLDVKGFAEENSLSEEEAGRILRYRAFDKYADGLIATAHNRGDTAETVIFNLIRGAGLRGMCGIPVQRGNIIRPLHRCTRAEIEGYLAECGQDFVTDETNLTTDYSRNRIRLAVIPELKKINSDAEGHIFALSERLRIDEDYISSQADILYNEVCDGKSLNAEILAGSHCAVSSRAVKRFLDGHGIPVCARLIDEILSLCNEKKSSRINVGEDVYITLSQGRIYITGERFFSEYCAPLSVGENKFLGKTVTAEIIEDEKSVKDAFVHRKFTNCYIDYDKIKGTLLLRNKRAGDRISLVGRGFESRLKKLLEKTPAYEKDRIAVLCDEGGVIFVENFGADERVKLSDDTTRILTLRIEVNDND